MNKKYSILLAVAMGASVMGSLVACGEKKEPEVKNSVVVGSVTELGGSDFASSDWGNNSADKDIRDLTNGYETVQLAKLTGEFVWDTRVTVKEHEEIENSDGTKTFKITINDNLKYSDGTQITAKDYVAKALAFASPIVLDAGITAQGGTAYVGYEAYAKATTPTPFAGIRLLDEYTFSYTMTADNFPYYYEISYAAFAPYSPSLWLGDDVEVKDDGEGAYLTEKWYETETDATTAKAVYKKAKQIERARYATTERPCSGPYKFVSWNSSEKKCVLTLNDQYLGNYEGQKPSIKEITYIKVVDETMFDTFKSGGVDIIAGVSGGEQIGTGLQMCKDNPNKYAYNSYLRAGYGKLQLVGDYGPTQFQAVRQAIAYLLDRDEFASSYTGGYGSIVNGPYGLSSWMYQEVQDQLDSTLNGYDFSVQKAKDLLAEDGWNYGADGKAYVSGVRYKKLSAEEAAINGNDTYQCGKTEFKTVKVGDDYFMPLAINWASTMPNPVTEKLSVMLANAKTTADAGVMINQEVIDFTIMLYSMYRLGEYATPAYGMFNLATGFNSAIYDYAGYWMTKYSKSNIIYAGVKPCEGATYTEADKDKYSEEDQAMIEATWEVYMSQGNNGFFADKEMDELTWAMVYESSTKEEYLENWVKYIQRWNEVLPEIPLYSDLYHDFYSAKISGYQTSPYWGTCQALIYCSVKGAK